MEHKTSSKCCSCLASNVREAIAVTQILKMRLLGAACTLPVTGILIHLNVQKLRVNSRIMQYIAATLIIIHNAVSALCYATAVKSAKMRGG
ncbi:hypothetical protein NC651_004182 [Populus alba x Populus x berolinensis]|nr:hypothetical protein NC651_004182 [Populus alba x Populus x berolinensis]